MTIVKSLLMLMVLTLAAGAAAEQRYGPGVTDTTIRIGNTHPYSGPASALGTIGKAIAAYFDKVNAQGGINGRTIDFISLDDGYNPSKTVEQVRKLVEREQVLLIFASLGTPTNSAVRKYLNRKQVPQLFLISSAAKWDRPYHYPWTMRWPPGFRTEARIYARYILENLPHARIGILYQNDDYGRDYLTGLRDGLGSRADQLIVAEESYEISDPTVHSQILSLKASGADVFIDITTPKFAAQAIKKVHEIGWRAVHFLAHPSASVGAVFKPAGLDKAEGILSVGYFKDPSDPRYRDDPAYRAWLDWMQAYYPEGDPSDPLNVAGYLAAQTLVHVLERAGDQLTRRNIMRQAATIRDLELGMLLPGSRINTAPDDYFPIEAMQMIRFTGTSWEPVGPLVDEQAARLAGSQP